jgi:tetratricopeptide (TPR) repeat protein
VFAKEKQQTVWVAVVLVLGTAVLYLPVAGFDFINLDDVLYVVQNPHVKNGLNWPALAWCWQAGYAGYWHPLTWLSHLLDCQLFGLNARPPHVENVLLHAANAVMLFVALKRMTGVLGRSAMVAALFAWHPLRVESVAWVAERKDVLSAFFWMLAMWTYVRYVEEFNVRNRKFKWFYALTLVFFALGLMAKPMVITLPCALLLLDWWPLNRLRTAEHNSWPRLILEKLPFFILTAASGVVTMIAAKRGDGGPSLNFLPLSIRISNALVSYARYVEKLVWPSHLSVFYRQDFKVPVWEVTLAAVFLASVTIAALVFRKSRPYWLMGWLWFLGTLVPVIGLVQAGSQAMADRFCYIPSIGLFIIVCWMAGDLTRQRPGRSAWLAVSALAALLACAEQTQAQLSYWRNSETLFQHALAIDPDNYVAHSCYGCYLRDYGQLERARIECQRALEIAPDYVMGYKFLSDVLEKQGNKEEAIRVVRASLKMRPDLSNTRCDLATLLLEKGLYAEAQTELEEGLILHPHDAELYFLLGSALARQRKDEAAEEQFAQAALLAPADARSHFQWALALADQHRMREAIGQYRAALQIQPDFANALNNLAWLLASNSDPQFRDGPEAVRLASRACALTRTNDALKIGTLAAACASTGRFEEAVAWAQKAREVALDHGQTNVAAQNLRLQKLYETHQPFYEGP